MSLEQMLWPIGLLLLALVVVAVNDKTKPKPKQATPPKKERPVSVLALLLGTGVIAALYACPAPVRTRVVWVGVAILGGIVLLVLVVKFRKVIWFLLKSALTGRLPRFVVTNADGELKIKCPHCSADISFSPVETGETTFECPQCGEKGRWETRV